MKKFTRKDHTRKSNKAKLVSQALASVKRGEPDNVINMREHFTRKLYINNKTMYNNVVKEA